MILIVEEGDSERALRCLHRDLVGLVIPLVRAEEKEEEPVLSLSVRLEA
jgi:aspartate kinase